MLKASATKIRILDAAEMLFAEFGFDGVPIREIMRTAEARLGLMSYYFESKEALLEDVIARRAGVLNEQRLSVFRAFAGMEESSLERIVDAIVDPYLAFMLHEEAGWRCYGQLIAVLGQTRRWNSMLSRYFDDSARVILDEIQRLYPSVDRNELIRAYTCSIGAMLHIFSISGRMSSLSGGAVDDEDLATNADTLKQFIVNGLKETLSQARPVSGGASRPLRKASTRGPARTRRLAVDARRSAVADDLGA